MAKQKKINRIASAVRRIIARKEANLAPVLTNDQATEEHAVKTKLAAELLVANMQLTFQNEEEEKHACEAKLAKVELDLRQEEMAKRASEAEASNLEDTIKHEEKVQLASDLLVANMTLEFQNKEKEKRQEELALANAELVFQNAEKEKRAAELILINKELTKAEEQQEEYIRGLEQMMFLTSHRVRQPVSNIIGMANLLDCAEQSPEDLAKTIQYMKESAHVLEAFTRELTLFIEQLGRKRETM